MAESAGAAPTIYKIYRGVIVIGLGLSLVKLWSAAIVFAAFIGYIAKSVLTYFRTKDKYQFELTRNLYVKNLDNNAGVNFLRGVTTLYSSFTPSREIHMPPASMKTMKKMQNRAGGTA